MFIRDEINDGQLRANEAESALVLRHWESLNYADSIVRRMSGIQIR